MAEEISDLLLQRGYRLESTLGRGGMGIVYRATQTSLNRPVAIKTLLTADADPATLKRFRREAKALLSIDHPNVVRVLDISPDDSPAYIVLELIEGAASLNEAWDRLPTDLPSRIALVRALAEGLAAAHALKIVHRDLKPGNVLLSRDIAKLIDFGLARPLSADETRHTRDGQILGTLAYMSPEQLRAEDVTLASDVYSFALLATEILARRPLFSSAPGQSPTISYIDRLQKGTPDLRTFCSDAPATLALQIARALSPTPADRPQSAQSFLSSLPTTLSTPDAAITAAHSPLAPPPAAPPARPRKSQPTKQLSAMGQGRSTPPARAPGLGKIAFLAVLLIVGVRLSLRAKRAELAVPIAPIGADARPTEAEVEISGRKRNLVLSVSAKSPVDLKVSWTARGEPRELVLTPSTTHKIDVPMDGFADHFVVSIAGRPYAVGPLLAPRLKRLADVLRPFDLMTCLRRLQGLSRRRQPVTQQEVSGLVPDGIHAALRSLGPALGVGLQANTDAALRRELVLRLSELDVLDSRLAHLGLPLCTQVASYLPAGWSEQCVTPESSELPTKHFATQQDGWMRINSRVNGVVPNFEWFASGPGWEWLNVGCNWVFPAPNVDSQICRMEWFQPQKSNVSYGTALCMVESVSKNSCGLRVEINDRVALAFSLVASKQHVNTNGVAVSWRLVPQTLLTKTLNRIKMTAIPYPDASSKPNLYVSSITVVGYAGDAPAAMYH